MNGGMNALRLLLCAGLLLGSGCWRTPTYVFEIRDVPPRLTEEVALEKAQESMKRAGFDLKLWRLREGTGFEQLGQTHWGRFHFTDGRKDRCVQVRLESNRIVCEVVQLP